MSSTAVREGRSRQGEKREGRREKRNNFEDQPVRDYLDEQRARTVES
jgi:hypothetical protein